MGEKAAVYRLKGEMEDAKRQKLHLREGFAASARELKRNGGFDNGRTVAVPKPVVALMRQGVWFVSRL
jgi:hypothetical protein